MKKVAFVVQRYGLEVNGGTELQCRLLAEKLTPFYDVEVITTKAIDYVTWKDEYTRDEEMKNGVLVSGAHDEVPICLGIFNDMFELPQAFFQFKRREEI